MSHKSDPRQYKDMASHRLSDQLEEWMKKKPIPYISNDKFSQEGIFDYWDSSMVALHLNAA